jgi:hypothetical protein
MQKPTAKQITDSYRKFKSKKWDKLRNKFLESICLQLLLDAQDGKNN